MFGIQFFIYLAAVAFVVFVPLIQVACHIFILAPDVVGVTCHVIIDRLSRFIVGAQQAHEGKRVGSGLMKTYVL